MIRFKIKDNIVIAEIDDKNGYIWSFKFQVSDKATAQIVAKHFNNKLFNVKEEIKDYYYHMGYRHGKSHTKKLR